MTTTPDSHPDANGSPTVRPDRTHPYIPNSTAHVQERMLSTLGVHSIAELHAVIPSALRTAGALDLPSALSAEADLRRELQNMLGQNITATQYTSYLGGGCWPHYVPAVCDEVGTRSEFVTAYHDGPRGMLGSYQAQFEFQSMLGELVGMDAVSTTTYDWASAAGSAMLMASRITGRHGALVHGAMSPDRLCQIRTQTRATISIHLAGWDIATGYLDLETTLPQIDESLACVYLELPSFLGVIDPCISEVIEHAHARGALVIVGVDPSALGVVAAPGSFGADIVVGEIQPLGMHMYVGGGCAGFIATRQDARFVEEFQTLLVSLIETEEDEFVFSWTNFEDTSYGLRDTAPDFTGTTQTIWSIVAASYLALMGPHGMRELGATIRRRSHYAMERLAAIPGVTIPTATSAHFKEFVVTFDKGYPTVAEINRQLLQHRIFGGLDLSSDLPVLGQSALYCVTEIHTKTDIDHLESALREVLS